MVEDAVVRYVMERYEAACQDDFPFKNRALQSWRSINSVLPKAWKFFGEVFNPISYIAVNDTSEHTMSALFARERFFDVHAEGGQSPYLPKPVAVELYREHVHSDLRLMRYNVRKFLQALDATSFGNGTVRHSAVVQNQPGGGLVLRANEANVSRFNFTPAAGALWMWDLPYAVERIPNVPLAEAIKLVKTKDRAATIAALRQVATTGIVMEAGKNSGTNERDFDLLARLEEAGYKRAGLGAFQNDGTSQSENLPKNVELLLYAERDDWGEWNRIIIIANRSVLVSDGPNPYAHKGPLWTDCKYSFINGETWNGRGVVDILRDEQDNSNILRNQINDFVERLRRPQTWVGEAAGVKRDDFWMFESAPGRVVPMQDIAGAKRIEERSDIVQLLIQLETMARANSDRQSGQTDIGRGMLGKTSGLNQGANTATGIQLFMRKQTENMTFKLMMMKENGFTDGLEKTASISQQTMREPRFLNADRNEVLSKHGISGTIMVEPGDIQGDFRLTAVENPMDDREEIQTLMDWLTVLKQLPDVAPRIKQMEIATFTGERAKVPTPSRFIMSDEEVAAKALKEQQASGGGMLGGVPPQLMAAGKMGVMEGVRNGARKVAEAGMPALAAHVAAGGVR